MRKEVEATGCHLYVVIIEVETRIGTRLSQNVSAQISAHTMADGMNEPKAESPACNLVYYSLRKSRVLA
jgi:hypothetical protein